MIEIPESRTISLQAGKTLTGRRITEIFNATSHHKFAWFSGNPAGYGKLLTGKQVKSVNGHGMFVDIILDESTCITIGEGTNMKYYSRHEKPPEKYQLLIVFDDESFAACNVAMYGGIWAYKGVFDNSYHQISLNSVSPLDVTFNETFFDNILKNSPKDFSAKALLATEQRIPGVGNGVLQDILFNSGIHPKRKKSTFTDPDKAKLFHSLKATLKKMTDSGGRDTEKDFFGNYGGYTTVLSKNTVKQPCPRCGNMIVKEAYLGGAVYFCPCCQKL
jgi:formamidopyrimidine-DNA glycosylase